MAFCDDGITCNDQLTWEQLVRLLVGISGECPALRVITGGGDPGDAELRDDDGFELRDDGGIELLD